jgi:hypothetical protein
MKTVPWIICCVLFAVILLQQACPRKQPNTVSQSDYDAMVKSKEDTVKYFNEIIKADDAAIDMATAHAEQSAQRARESEDKLTEAQSIIDRQNEKINAARKEQVNGSFIPVSPNYIEGCDSLQLLTSWQGSLINKHKQDNVMLKAANEHQVASMNKKLQDQQEFNASMKSQINNCLAKFKAKDSAKVKNQWFGEIGLMGNPTQPIGGGEIGLTLINKRGVLYGVKAQLSAGQIWYGAKTGFKLFR